MLEREGVRDAGDFCSVFIGSQGDRVSRAFRRDGEDYLSLNDDLEVNRLYGPLERMIGTEHRLEAYAMLHWPSRGRRWFVDLPADCP